MNREWLQTLALIVIALSTTATAIGVWMHHHSDEKEALAAVPTIQQHALAQPAPALQSNKQDVVQNVPVTKVEFDSYEHDFGTIREGEKVRHVFRFKNVGEHPLIIRSARGSCGCTVPTWPKEPIPPGGTGEIPVEFNSKGQRGQVQKSVFIDANTDPSPIVLKIRATVVQQ